MEVSNAPGHIWQTVSPDEQNWILALFLFNDEINFAVMCGYVNRCHGTIKSKDMSEIINAVKLHYADISGKSRHCMTVWINECCREINQ
jgi:hypothetical protein